MLWGRGTSLTRPTHFLGYGKIRLYEAVARLSVSVPAADRSRGRGEEGFDLVHGRVSFAGRCRLLNKLALEETPTTARARPQIEARMLVTGNPAVVRPHHALGLLYPQ